MGVNNIFSKRDIVQDGIYQYEYMPDGLKEQIIHIFNYLTCQYSQGDMLVTKNTIEFWKYVGVILCEEYGVSTLNGYSSGNIYWDVKEFFRFQNREIESCLDIIELPFKILIQKHNIRSQMGLDYAAVLESIERVNMRFREHSLGYELVLLDNGEESNCEIIRIDNKEIHNKIIKVSLNLIQENGFEIANKEYIESFEKYKEGDYKESLVASERAFESCMKVICDKLGYLYKQNDGASKLVSILKQGGFIEGYIQDHLNGLVKTLQSGLPTVRNNLGGHGAGVLTITVERETAEYALNLAATNIVYLISIYNKKK